MALEAFIEAKPSSSGETVVSVRFSVAEIPTFVTLHRERDEAVRRGLKYALGWQREVAQAREGFA